MKIAVPSKTFLLGEYGVLKGAPALILTTERYFYLHVSPKTKSFASLAEGIHPDSPAGKLINTYKEPYQSYLIQFEDPYQSMGGLGASSAQFLMVYALYNHLHQQPIDSWRLLEDYLHVAWDGQGMAPSGADVVAQFHGSVCCFQRLEQQIQLFNWPFKNLSYCLVQTGNKLSTHHYLTALNDFDTAELESIIRTGIESFRTANELLFIESIQQYTSALQRLGFVADRTLDLCQLLLHHPEILAAKGCGALGSDVIFVIFQRQKTDKIISWMKKKHLNIITYGFSVAEGLKISE